MTGDPEGQNEREIGAMVSASRVGYEFIGAVAGCTVAGWLADRFFGTGPWGTLGMLFLGFVVGMFNLWRSLNSKT